MQSTHVVLMIEPVRFYSNPSTQIDNAFQTPGTEADDLVQARALSEFHGLRDVLERNGVTVEVWRDRVEANTPDSIFPNNWFSTHREGSCVLYPMRSKIRRGERRPDVIAWFQSHYPTLIDLTVYEAEERFLEGTGSLVLDRMRRVAYACVSPRTDRDLVERWCEIMGYAPCIFTSVDGDGTPIYHTNVMMSVGTGYAVLCAESIPDHEERAAVIRSLELGGAEIVEITPSQMNEFCGNVLELSGNGRALLAMSSRAYSGFTEDQRAKLGQYAHLVYAPLDTIERLGGGSARCMIAEIHRT
jgi:hypothetical protein